MKIPVRERTGLNLDTTLRKAMALGNHIKLSRCGFTQYNLADIVGYCTYGEPTLSDCSNVISVAKK